MPKSIYIIAGETSGDVLGGRLMEAMQAQGNFAFNGVGGDMMTVQGLNTLFPMSDLSVMGVFEVLPKLPKLINRIRQTVSDIVAKQPDIVITIDAPDFCKRVVKKARKKCPDTKFVHYVAPTVWAWRSGRAKTMAELFDGLICLLPFEPDYFEKQGLKAQFCGHPVVEKITDEKLERTDDHVLILPGSRHGEVSKMSPVFADVFKKMKAMNPDLQAKIVALPHLKEEIEECFFGLDVSYIDPNMRYDAFKKAPFALATSGTVGLELAVAECPHIISYKMNPLTWWVLKRMVYVRYAHLVNIMENKEIIPECIQDKCEPSAIMNAVTSYQNHDLSFVRQKLKGENAPQSPSQQAADFIFQFL